MYRTFLYIVTFNVMNMSSDTCVFVLACVEQIIVFGRVALGTTRILIDVDRGITSLRAIT